LAVVALLAFTPGCDRASPSSGDAAAASTSVTTSAVATTPSVQPRVDDVLLTTAGLGPTFEDQPFTPGSRPEACDVGIADEPVATDSRGANMVSNAAMERVTQELLEFSTPDDARHAFDQARLQASCGADGNLDASGGAPGDAAVAGTADAFAIGFVNSNGSAAVCVALVDHFLAVFSVDFHFGVATDDGVFLDEVAALGVAKLLESR
jgi:hypothetical protein